MSKLKWIVGILLVVVGCKYADVAIPLTGKEGVVVHWERHHYPLKLSIESKFNMSQRHTINSAVYAWESAAKRDLFEVNVEPDFWKLLNPAWGVTSMAVGNVTQGNGAEHEIFVSEKDKSLMHSARITLLESETQDPATLYPIVLHELGHTLLLDHDEGEVKSIMFKSALDSGAQILDKHVKHIHDEVGPGVNVEDWAL